MAMRDPTKEHFWRQALARHQASDLSVRAFCEGERLSEASFYQWRRELSRRDRHRPRFLPVVVADPEKTAVAAGAVEIVLGSGRVVRVYSHFDRQTLADVLAILEDVTC